MLYNLLNFMSIQEQETTYGAKTELRDGETSGLTSFENLVFTAKAL